MSPASGAPCWVSLTTHDMSAAQAFYRKVLGWEFAPGRLGPRSCVAVQDEFPVAGISEPLMAWQLPSVWAVYFQVEDADVAADRIQERVGTMAVGPVRAERGRVGLAADPYGAPFGVWQGPGMDRWAVGENRSPAWLELRTPDAFAAALFYGEVFGWATGRSHCEVAYEVGDNEVFVRVADQTVAGLKGAASETAEEQWARPQWHVYFRVPDTDAAAAAATAAGGSVVSPPEQMPLGRAAALRSPEGAFFSVLTG